ncbi:MAG: leucine-rich repeat protein [Clostridia bacterium]|nr:leucine-rich repeat protein [Clostridia bacterium]
MKKKIVLMLSLVFAFVCIFAISVSAQDRTSISYTDFDGVTHDVPVVKYDVTREAVKEAIDKADNLNIKDVSAMMDDGAYTIVKATDGSLTAYPTWYLIEPIDGSAISEIRYGYLNSVSGKTYERGAIRYIEFPEGMTYVRNNSVFGLKNGSSPYERNVTEFVIPSTVNAIQAESFSSMPYLKKVWIKPDNTIKDIPNTTFSNSTNLEYIQFENLNKLEAIGGLTNCNLTGDIDLSNTQLKTIRDTCFKYNLNMGKITLPDTVEVIEDGAFQNTGNAYLASSYLPKNLTSVGKLFFAYNTNLLDTYIFPEGVTELPNEPFQDSKVAGGPEGKELNVVFLGEVTGVVYLNGNGHQKHAEKVTVYFAKNSLSDYNQNGFYIKPSGSSVTSVPGAIRAAFCEETYQNVDGKITGIEYIYITNTAGTSYTADMVNDAENGFDFANHKHFGTREITKETCGKDGFVGTNCFICDLQIGEVIPATGNHTTTDDHDCTTDLVCEVCENVVVEALKHIIDTTYNYGSGYAQNGEKRVGCTRVGCQHGTTTVILPLFNSYGYSKDEVGEGVSYKVFINKEALDEYTAYLEAEKGEEVSVVYGVVAAISGGEESKPVNSNGEVADGYSALIAEASKTNFVILEVKLCGITEKSLALNCNAYIIFDGTVYYINGDETNSYAKNITYNSL